ncbi:MAG: hypothetical protein LQ352_005925, partial [Teloschistes flavicans]
QAPESASAGIYPKARSLPASSIVGHYNHILAFESILDLTDTVQIGDCYQSHRGDFLTTTARPHHLRWKSWSSSSSHLKQPSFTSGQQSNEPKMALSPCPIPPMTHPCSPLPLPPTSPTSPHYRPSLKRWSRSSTYQKILERDEDDWCNGGMGVPLIAVDSGLGSSINEKVAQVTRPQTGTGSSKRRSRWSILSIGSMNGNGGAANDPFVDPVANVGAVGNDAAQTRKRKRWSNSVGSATTTVVGGVRSSIARFTGYESAGSGNIGVSQSRFGDSDEEDRVQRRKRRIKRVMRGAMQSFAGFSYGMVY